MSDKIKDIPSQLKAKTFGAKYYLHKPLFRFGLILVVAFVMVLIMIYGVKPHQSITCESERGWCEYEGGLIPSGTMIGEPAPFLIKHFPELCLLFFAWLFLLNHYKFNWRKKKDEN